MYFRMLNKKQVKSAFNISHRIKLSDEDFQNRALFIINTMSWNDYEVKCFYRDFKEFQKEFNPDWQKLYQNHIENINDIKTKNPLFPDETDEMYYARKRKEDNEKLRQQREKQEQKN
jgi:hypothetical protein